MVKIKADLLNSESGSAYCRFKPFSPWSPAPTRTDPAHSWSVHIPGWPPGATSVPPVAEFLAPRPHVNQVARPDGLLNCARTVDLVLKELLWPQGSEQLRSPLSTGQDAKKKMIPSVCPATLNPRTAGCTVACRGQGHHRQSWTQAATPLSY